MRTGLRTIGVFIGAICILILFSFTRTESTVTDRDVAATTGIEAKKVAVLSEELKKQAADQSEATVKKANMEAKDTLGKIELLANVEAAEYHNSKNSALTNQATDGKISDMEQRVLDEFIRTWEGFHGVAFDETTGVLLLTVQDDNFMNFLSNLPNGDNESKQIWDEYIFTMVNASQKMLSDFLGKGYSIALVNPSNQNNILLDIYDGVVVYDFLNNDAEREILTDEANDGVVSVTEQNMLDVFVSNMGDVMKVDFNSDTGAYTLIPFDATLIQDIHAEDPDYFWNPFVMNMVDVSGTIVSEFGRGYSIALLDSPNQNELLLDVYDGVVIYDYLKEGAGDTATAPNAQSTTESQMKAALMSDGMTVFQISNDFDFNNNTTGGSYYIEDATNALTPQEAQNKLMNFFGGKVIRIKAAEVTVDGLEPEGECTLEVLDGDQGILITMIIGNGASVNQGKMQGIIKGNTLSATANAMTNTIINNAHSGSSAYGEFQVSINLLPAGEEVPMAPMNLRATIDYSNGAVQLTWEDPNPAGVVVAYDIYNFDFDAMKDVKIATVSDGLSWVDQAPTTVPSNTLILSAYHIVARGANGKESVPSNTVTLTYTIFEYFQN